MGCGQSTLNDTPNHSGRSDKLINPSSGHGGKSNPGQNNGSGVANSPGQPQVIHWQPQPTSQSKHATQPYVVPPTNDHSTSETFATNDVHDNKHTMTVAQSPGGTKKNNNLMNKALQPISPSGSRKVRNFSSSAQNKGGKALVPPPPLVARERSDTWADLTTMNGTPQQLQITLDFDAEFEDETPHQQEMVLNETQAKSLSQGASTSTTLASQQQQQFASFVPPKNYADFSKYAIQDQWKMIWETQSGNLVDPADVPVVIDRLLDKIVNRLSPVQLTFIQRKVRHTIHRMYHSTASTSKSHTKKSIFGNNHYYHPQSNGSSSSVSASTLAIAEISEAKALIGNYHLLSPAVVRHVLPKPLPNGNASILLSGVATNAITLMMSLSCTSSESFLWDRAAFAAQAAAKIANLEMDVNKKKITSMPKPSQVPIIEGGDDASLYPPGITLTALSAIISLALQSPFRDQKLQLLFYLCMKPESLVEFLTGHPAGGVPVWLLEVGNDVVVSLASLAHYHYYGHAFLPTFVPMHDSMDPSTLNGNSNRYSMKHKFIASQSRQPITVPLKRVHSIVHSLLDTEQQNLHTFKEKRLALIQYEDFDVTKNTTNGNTDSTNFGSGLPSQMASYYVRRLRSQDTDPLHQAPMQNHGRDINNGALNASIHKIMGRKGSLNTAVGNSTDGSSNNQGDGADVTMSHLPHHFEGSSIFALTDVMERITDISDGIESDSVTFCFPSDNPSLSSPLDASREKFHSGTTAFFVGKSATEDNGIELTLEEFVHWADLSLDNLALNLAMHKLFGDGILPSPAMERELVLHKWLEWEDAIRVVMTISNISNRCEVSDMNTSNHGGVDTNGGTDTNNHSSNNHANSAHKVSDMVSVLLSTETFNGLYNTNEDNDACQMIDSLLHGVDNEQSNGDLVQNVYHGGHVSLSGSGKHKGFNSFFVWGGLGMFDGGGGIGYGILYCISKQWWDQWTEYTGWSFQKSNMNDKPALIGRKKKKAWQRRSHHTYGEKRPWTISAEDLLEPEHDSIIRGSMGSYELMKRNLIRDEDYVLVPPGVWDVLFEMYGGGPPLPRMIRSPERHFSETNRSASIGDLSVFQPSDEEDMDMNEYDDNKSVVHIDEKQMNEVEIMPNSAIPKAIRIPDGLSVTLHPWVIHVQLCDPMQPYRRGEAGHVSIRIMATPYQPLWRLFAEAICRFSFQGYKAYSPTDGRGKARLWKKTDPATTKEPVTRYGPWNLLCKNRHGILPMMSSFTKYWIDAYDVKSEELVHNWKEYADNATLETGGLSNNDQLMLEFAIQNKYGELAWPREAAAKAGRVRRLAEEDRKFRQLLQGLGEDGNVLLKPPSLVGLDVDAMDTTGKWYTVNILEVNIVDDDTEEEADDDVSRGGKSYTNQQAMSRKKVKVMFHEHGGHTEWIDVESDRLATAGRFASQADQDGSTTTALLISNASSIHSSSTADKGSKAIVTRKNANSDDVAENGKLCILPGFGACGLSNLGNTCYMNSALQCMSYLPLLRSYLLSSQFRSAGDLNRENFLGSGGKLLEETAELMKYMWSTNFGEKSPTKFKIALGKVNPQFFGADQQDAQEFLNYIIDVLHEDGYKHREKPYVEALEDEFVKNTNLARVGEEAWRRFLRRNRSMMADVSMGQALNTVTCPVCKYSSRIFDPFNLLSIPIPTISDVLFQCTVYRRATAKNCPWVLGKVRKGDKRNCRFEISSNDHKVSGPPSEYFVAEQYIIALSRLADSGDLRLQIQNLCGIRANQLRLCKAEDAIVNKDAKDGSVVKTQKKVFPLSDKDGPASQHIKKRGPNEDNHTRIQPTEIIAFEMTLNPRNVEVSKDGDDEEEDESSGEDYSPSPRLAAIIEKHLEVYGDELECRMVDTDSLLIAKAVSRSLWPRSEDELKLGLRVDAMDHRGNWFPGSVIEIVDNTVKGADADNEGAQTEANSKCVRVHFDNFSSKWDEMYSIEHMQQGRVMPLYSHAIPKRKPTEFLVHHRHTDRQTGQLVVFGQSFYVQCQNEWSNARAGAHILAQVCRFMQYNPNAKTSSDSSDSRSTDFETKAQRLYEKTYTAISDLIDLLVDCDREYVRLALGVSQHNNAEEKARPFRNPTFDASLLSSALVKKVSGLLQRLPFEVCICTVETAHSDKPNSSAEEVFFPFSLVRTIGNFMNIRNAVFLQWREQTIADKKQPSQVISYRSYLNSPVMYVDPVIHQHESCTTLLNDDGRESRKKKSATAGGSAGIELSFCLKEFCKVQKLSISDNWNCPICKVHREGAQNMNIWRLPDLLTFHIKRFNMSARWHEKITTKVNFPITGLDMSEFCHPESPVFSEDRSESAVYDLIGVMNHYGSMTGGHYVATCKATACSKDGREEVAYSFNGVGASTTLDTGLDEPVSNGSDGSTPGTNLSGAWIRLSHRQHKNHNDITNQNRVSAALASKAASESAEPMWLQFDDEIVEAIPPKAVVSEMAYVLFYRRRNISAANIARYSSLE